MAASYGVSTFGASRPPAVKDVTRVAADFARGEDVMVGEQDHGVGGGDLLRRGVDAGHRRGVTAGSVTNRSTARTSAPMRTSNSAIRMAGDSRASPLGEATSADLPPNRSLSSEEEVM